MSNKLPYSLKNNHKAIVLFVCLAAAGLLGNCFAPQVFNAFFYLSGSIPVLLILLLFGFRWGVVAGLAISLGSIIVFKHPYYTIWLLAEPLFVGWLLSKGRTRNIILYDAIFWPLLGAPALFLASAYLLNADRAVATTITLLYWTAGVINAVAASLLITYVPFQKYLDGSDESQSVPISQLIFNLMMATALSPTIVILLAANSSSRPPLSGVELSKLDYLQAYPENLLNTLAALIILNMAALATSLYTSVRLTAPLRQLTRITTDLPDQLMKGKPTPWPESMVEEIDQLGYNFRAMATALSYKFQEITYYSETLETRVRERTRELTKINSQLRKEIAEHRSTEKHRNQLLVELQNKNKELEGIVYVASHDLRSPLVNVQGFSRKLASGCEDLDRLTADLSMEPERKQKLDKILQVNIPKYIGYITGSVDKMGLLIKGLLRLSRLGQASLCFDRLDMKRIMENIVSSMAFQIDSINARVNLGELKPCMSDQGQVTQIFSNLLDNTIKYNSPGRQLEVSIFSEEFDDGVRYCVEDNGIGISDAHKDKIWEIFHRLNPDAAPGEGMGLTLARQIVSRLGGSIWVESELNVGSRFYVVLPKDAPNQLQGEK